MNAGLVGALCGFGGAVFATIVNAFLDRRKTSGNVATSTADQLWNAVNDWAQKTAERAQMLEKKADDQAIQIIDLTIKVKEQAERIKDLERKLEAVK